MVIRLRIVLRVHGLGIERVFPILQNANFSTGDRRRKTFQMEMYFLGFGGRVYGENPQHLSVSTDA